MLEKLFPKTIKVFENGSFGALCDNGVYSQSTNFSTAVPFTLSSSYLGTPGTYSSQSATLVSREPIDFANYSEIRVVHNLGTETIDISNVNSSGYLFISATGGSNQQAIWVSVCQNKQNKMQEGSNRLAQTSNDYYVTSRINISSITVS